MSPLALFVTWFGAGRVPRAPGTVGSLAALPFAWVLASAGGTPLLLAATLLVTAAAIPAAGRYAATRGEDPQDVVVDEVAGQWLALATVAPDPWLYALGFVFFRIADIAKPWPASWADRRLPGGWGIVLDDVLAGVYAMLALHAVTWGIGFWSAGP